METNTFYDKEVRNKIRKLDKDSLAQLMTEYTSDVRVKVLTNTQEITYFVIPTSGTGLDLHSLKAGSVFGSVGCLACFGCASSTVSTGGTASTWVLHK